MAERKPSVTGTAHTLPFDKLSPREFERLCLWLVEWEGYEGAEHLGATGSEQGRDIVAWRAGELWTFQCKRVEEFGPRDAEAEVDKVLGLPEGERPAGLVFLVACDVSDETRRRARARCGEGMGCEFWALTELDERVKDHPEIVEEFFEAGGDEGDEPRWWRRFRRHPAVFYPTLVFGIVAAIVGLVAGLVGIGADLGGARRQAQGWGLLPSSTPTPTCTPTPTATPTPLPFASASEDEVLIVIASFYHSEGVPDTEAHWEICRAIRKAKDDLGYSNLRVEVEPTRLRAEDRDGAEELGRRYDASMIIWGADTGVRVMVNYLNLKDPEFAAAEVEISETERTWVANPSAYAYFVTYNLPGQLTFLSLFAIGQSYYTEEAYPESLEAIRKAIDSLPSETDLVEGLAEAYFRLGWLHQVAMDDGEAAIADYAQAIDIDSQLKEAYLHRGIAYRDKGDYDAAIADHKKAIDIDPQYKDAYGNLGLAYREKGEYDAAIAEYNKVIDIDPQDKRAYLHRGNAYRYKEDYGAAIAEYNKAIDIDPQYKCAYYSRGVAYWEKGEYDAAIADYTQAIDIDGYYANAYWGRGLAHRGVGNAGAALADFRRYLELRPDAENREMFEEWIAELEAEVSER